MTKITNNFKPRLLRLRDAPRYLGMDRHRFNIDVRSYVTEIKIGNHGVAFDTLELDAWVDNYKQHHSRPPATQRLDIWPTNKHSKPTSKVNVTTSTARQESIDEAYAKALQLILQQKKQRK